MIPNIYLAGPMEAAEDGKLGSEYREAVTARLLCEFDVNVLNPCEFEPEQLKGLRPDCLPDEFTTRKDKVVKPSHWHELKLAPRNSSLYKRFKKYMRRIINYDTKLVERHVDYVIAYWTAGTAAGAGTHSEMTIAYRCNIPVYVVADIPLPGWAEGCATEVFDNWEELFEFLGEELGK
jgi:hypothetical protein